ncbi:NAD(P)-binding protein [Polyplosphaeria fusca]|uniref:NAD(P)-binding protein n=1 Tax=Polyplosphaeria fusca TaxID=682080 RepID=A0A9P4QZ51_9PLEO|nr:NAD(P)-binding protein [Polyplosphaeria fusca]
MVVVAIAGGAGNVGRTLLEAVDKSVNHQAVVLSRKVGQVPHAVIEGSEAPVVVVDYNDVEALTVVLEQHKVHTLISALMLMTPEAGAAETSLVKAAAASGPTKRFIASEWGGPSPETFSPELPQSAYRRATQAELRKTELEWTKVYNGLFLEYYGMPYVESFLPSFTSVVDMPYKTAAIPGTGDDVMTFIYSKDMAALVVAALDLPAWEETLSCIGEKMTWNEFVRVAEEITDSKFKVSYDPEEKLRSGKVTLLPSGTSSYAVFTEDIYQGILSVAGLHLIAGLFDLPEEYSLSRKFPEIKVMGVRDMLSVWKGK